MAADWIYLFTTNDRFPDPTEEIAYLAGLWETGKSEPMLLLADRKRDDPPMKTAVDGEQVLLCTRGNDRKLRCHGTAKIAGPGRKLPTTPQALIGLYGALAGRIFKPIRDVALEEVRLVHELTPAAQETMARGQSYVRRLGNRRSRSRRAGETRGAPRNYTPPRIRLAARPFVAIPSGTSLGGLDPTAGTWASAMLLGPKAMPSCVLAVGPDGRLMGGAAPVQFHTDNDGYHARMTACGVGLECIDGPCATNGLPVLPDWSGWGELGQGGKRDAESDLFAEGVGLFWTTANTLTAFDGASRWIARSLRLFQDARGGGRVAIETHPHGAFTFLWRCTGRPERLYKKTTAAGRAQRVAILQAFIADFDPKHYPDDDAIDAACAALVAALHVAGMTRPFGTQAQGGVIHMPDKDKLAPIISC